MEKPEKLFGKFPPVSTKDWEEKIREDLRGADPGKLSWTTAGGLLLKPYYRQEDLKELEYLSVLPGEYPFVRGNRTRTNTWEIRQDIPAMNAREANEKAVRLLQAGVTSPGFICDSPDIDLSVLLSGISLETVPVNFCSFPDYGRLIDTLIHYAAQLKADPGKVTGSIDTDLLTGLLLKDRPENYHPALLNAMSDLMVHTHQSLPGFRIITIRADHLHNSGSTTVQELAFSLAAGAEYLTCFSDAGLPADMVTQHMQLQFAVGPGYFVEIAKLRAARILWARMTDHYPASRPYAGKIFIHSCTSRWNQTAYDPHTNILRGTGEAMAAIIGGTDSLEVIPFDASFRNSNEFSERVARNIQIILKEEAYLDKVIDPGAGSYYIEVLTDSLVHHAWEQFLEIESAGGFLQAAGKNLIQEKIRTAAKERIRNIALRKEILTGTNQYPVPGECIAGVINPEIYLKWTDPGDDDSSIIHPSRGAIQMEALRLKTERSAVDASVFILPMGNIAMRRARAAFACNFFTCGGFNIMDNMGFDNAGAAIKEVTMKHPAIVVLCSSDDEYPDITRQVVDLLKNKTIIVIAGYPKEHMATLKEMGIEHFIHVRSNVFEELKKFQELLGIEKAEGE
jgi:methylmalonyl-CoA mutase